MFSLFRSDPLKKLRKQRDIKLGQAMQAQRNGDMERFAGLSEEADALWQQIQRMEQERDSQQ